MGLKQHDDHRAAAHSLAQAAHGHGHTHLADAAQKHLIACDAATAAYDSGDQTKQIHGTAALLSSAGNLLTAAGNTALMPDEVAAGVQTLSSLADGIKASLPPTA